MKLVVIPLLAALSACTTVEYVPVRTQSNTPPTIVTRPDPAARVIEQCDRLGFTRHGEAHRLCIMRGVDRLAVVPGAAPLVVEPKTAPIQILPYPYPPLAPKHHGHCC